MGLNEQTARKSGPICICFQKRKKQKTVDTLGGNEPAKVADVADAEEKADSALNWPVAESIAEPKKRRSTFSKEVLQRVILPAKE